MKKEKLEEAEKEKEGKKEKKKVIYKTLCQGYVVQSVFLFSVSC